MRHASPEELLDVAEGVRDEASLPHLTDCAACREQLRDVRDVLTGLKDVPVPEPSPLFWDHLSARVRDAVAADAVTPAPWRWRPWALVPAAAVLALALVVARWPGRSNAPADAPAPRAAASPAATVLDGTNTGDATDAASMAWMLELADGLDLEAAESAGLFLAAGSTDAAVGELSVDEQRELEQLLKAALREPGA